jgi:hypothetical protein
VPNWNLKDFVLKVIVHSNQDVNITDVIRKNEHPINIIAAGRVSGLALGKGSHADMRHCHSFLAISCL